MGFSVDGILNVFSESGIDLRVSILRFCDDLNDMSICSHGLVEGSNHKNLP